MSGESSPDYTPANAASSYTPPGAPDNQPYLINIDEHGKHRAQANTAAVTREQWKDYQNRFVPVENQLIDTIGNPQYYAGQVQNATDAVGSAYANEPGEYQRNMSRYGVQPDATQTANQQRNYGLSGAAATAQAANQTRGALANRDIQIMGGGIVPQDPTKQPGGN